MTGRDQEDLLMSHDERLAVAYRERARKVAFQERSDAAGELADAMPDDGPV